MIDTIGMQIPLFGVAGVLILLLAWAIETYSSVKKHKILIDNRFATIYLTACVFLIIYAHEINDPIFFWLQIGLAALVIFEILFGLRLKKKKK